MSEPEEIFDVVRLILGRGGPLAGKRILVTAGGTQEPVDPVRFLGNRSSGKMGYAVADEAVAMGANVTLISAPVSIKAPAGVELVQVETAQEMHDAVLSRLPDSDALVMAASVADYRPQETSSSKMKRSGASLTLALSPTMDILRSVREWADTCDTIAPLIVGFAAETDNLEELARGKLAAKGLDVIVGNDVSKAGSGFGSDTNEVIILTREGSDLRLPVLPKTEVAQRLLAVVKDQLSKRG
jgi:phosphopantothenoylcysteine decarboxylase / phosphopantothenate---cysteine ligase